MDEAPRISRRRLIIGLGSVAVGTAITHRLVKGGDPRPKAYYAPLVLPPVVPPLTRQRLQHFHARYDAIASTSGIPAMRTRILSDIRGFRGHDEWLETIAGWIRRVGWAEAADLCIDIAEIGSENTRRNCAAALSNQGSPLLIPNGYGPRIIRLHQSETDGAARSYWVDLRRMLGI